MSFTNNKAIFEQIADRLADESLADGYPASESMRLCYK